MFGIFPVDKPAGWSSRDVVNRIQRVIRPARVGHAGTLDPLATGVLVVCVGPATRLIPYVQQMPKSYRAVFILGRESDTEDISGQWTEHPVARVPSAEELTRALPPFMGRILQQPPAYSALKVGGRRAYALARAGQAVSLAPRPVEIFDLQLIHYDFPEFCLQVQCGSGTYVRSLGRDIARHLGTSAVMSQLQRTAVGNFDIQSARSVEQVTGPDRAAFLLPPLAALGALPRATVQPKEVDELAQGRSIPLPDPPASGELAAIDESGRLVAILTPRGEATWGPKRFFARC